ncbi:ComF family protein [Caproiciproducens sp. MSJ-32]|uniref:ComF family protein n=1 Tax=Caproiciproducens sp. MSJ-32 TaxID=2841527 RepID=UPI001C129839|nr:ComF family protein [Caproiciproducens sp. MSJ-32]MBU5454361.1 ComF family protein [Caproiciproducens sp. MSJ-32]
MGKGIIKILKTIINELLYIIYPPDNKCIVCGEEYIGVCPLCLSKIQRVKENSEIYSYAYYSGVIKEIILKFKYKKVFLAGNILADFLYELIQENKIEADGILYVPCSKETLRRRGFNQCEIMARILGEKLDIPVYNDLIKIKNTKEQKILSREERFINIKNAFKLKNTNNVKDKRIILIDDVITTGATLLECEKILKENGVKEIKILTVAKSYI